MTGDIVNTRRFLRFDAKQANITGKICDRNDAVLCNFSLGGASFLLKSPIEINSSCKVEIRDGDKTFHVHGRVVWERNLGEMTGVPESYEGMYTIGVVFINTYNNESGANLTELIRRIET